MFKKRQFGVERIMMSPYEEEIFWRPASRPAQVTQPQLLHKARLRQSGVQVSSLPRKAPSKSSSGGRKFQDEIEFVTITSILL